MLPLRRLSPRLWLTGLGVLVVAGMVGATETTVPPPGIREHTPAISALTHARIVAAPGRVIENGTVVIRDGIIIAAGAQVAVPADATIFDLTGKTVYAGFIDAYSELGGPPKPPMERGGGRGRGQEPEGPGTPAPKGGANYWNSKVVPQTRADQLYQPDNDANKNYRSQGIAVRLVAPSEGIIKGTSALVTTGDGDNTRSVLKDHVALHAMLTTRGGFGEDSYPTSPMGAYTLFRQAFYDADWYRQAWDAYRKDKQLPRPERNDALDALQGYAGGTAPVVIDASDILYDLRADRIGKEFNLNVIVRGSGQEYRLLDAIKASGRSVILPLEFPKPPNVKTPEEAMGVSLETLMHWDIAPENAGRLAQAGVPIAFMSQGLKDTKDFLGAVRKAVQRGLSADAALTALTVTPAGLYGIADRLGTIDAGKAGNLVVTDGDLFADKTQILETWVDGQRYENKPAPLADVRGAWRLTLSEKQAPTDTIKLLVKGDPDKLSGTLSKNGKEAKLNDVGLNDARLGFNFKGDSLGWNGVVRMTATLDAATLIGTGAWSDGAAWTWTGERIGPFTPEADTSKPKPPQMASFPVNFPFGAFGTAGPPAQPAAVLFKNATVWTCGPQGKMAGASVLVQSGKITAVGANVNAPTDAVVVDLVGKHLTPGLMDCHSHIATDGGINESGQTISAEVRIGDFIDPTDISIYRELAGGLTEAHVLHGSANTIGGQLQLIKLRWGALPEQMKFDNWPGTIKFALGENVKQSNWGDRYTTRYPQTRMGVEQLVRDEFTAARQYKARWEDWKKRHAGIPPRRDLELDAIVEILDGTRFIHCHSYRQDEILALMRTCEDFGVKIAAFQHILEGYKVADVMAKDGIGGSCFTDWWAYKIEVYDAIPYDGALMHNAGVVVSFNSDSDELARRLNWECAKATKYGGVPEEEALKFVTINTAKQLKVDNRVGSIEVGKDADLAVWSGPPMSTYSICEQTWIDGRQYFDRTEDAQRRIDDQKKRATLIQKILQSGDETPPGGGDHKGKWPRCDVFDEQSVEMEGGR
ncbi:MAG: amidohydrolase family protein [candidate division Zixibacteria bacterium]|nr:amidohydrolase family protein [candidate division Zixibacteria bacterium]